MFVYLIKPDNALEECSRFLKPLEEFASKHLETHVLAFEVYLRKNKLMLMLKSMKKIRNLEKSQAAEAKFHYSLCTFLIKC